MTSCTQKKSQPFHTIKININYTETGKGIGAGMMEKCSCYSTWPIWAEAWCCGTGQIEMDQMKLIQRKQ